MTILLYRAQDVFAPTDARGERRGASMSAVRAWGLQVEQSMFASGTWTPGLTFETPGDQNIVLSTAEAYYVRVGSLYILEFRVVTSTFTHTTASGALQITGLPVSAGDVAIRGALAGYQGITKANFTAFSVGAPAGQSYLTISGSGSAQGLDTTITTADMPSGGSVNLRSIATVIAPQ